MTKRSKIRLLSFAVAVIAALSVWGTTQTLQNSKMKREISVSQQRTITSLADYVDSLANDLRKMQYVNTSTMASTLSMSLCKASAGAKNCLSSLSSGDVQLTNINKFLTQSSDYVQSITKRVSNGETLTEQDHRQIAQLYDYAVKLSDQISYLEEVMFAGGVHFNDVTSTLSKLSDEGDLSVSYSSAVSDAEKSFSDYPTLIYDGPFADNVFEKNSEMLKFEKEISESEAKKKAAEYSGVKADNLIRQEDENSTIKAYVFYCDGMTVAVTKNGGYLLYMLSDTFAGEEKLNADDAIQKARQYLEKIGFSSIKDSYYSINDGICTVNFAYTLGDVICYADLIKVGVALDTGKIVSADTEGYLMNHKQRSVSNNILTRSEAQKSVSANLTVEKNHMAIIPMSDGKEVYTYEFLCNDKDGNDVLVYIDAQTGKEADIKLLLYSDGGILTR